LRQHKSVGVTTYARPGLRVRSPRNFDPYRRGCIPHSVHVLGAITVAPFLLIDVVPSLSHDAQVSESGPIEWSLTARATRPIQNHFGGEVLPTRRCARHSVVASYVWARPSP